jgi:hypothetical protein
MTFELESSEWRSLQATATKLVEKESRDGLSSLSELEKTFFLVWVADGEVGNGGMHAVCYNSTGDYLMHLPSAFRAIGAPVKAAAFDSLINAFGIEPPSPDHDIRLEQHSNLSARAEAAIDALDAVYYAAGEDVTDLLYSYARPLLTQAS